jgi:hypothetical protein
MEESCTVEGWKKGGMTRWKEKKEEDAWRKRGDEWREGGREGGRKGGREEGREGGSEGRVEELRK